MYKFILRPLFFLLPPERAHRFTIRLFEFLLSIPPFPAIFKSWYQLHHPQLEREAFGLRFKNPVGLAAGFDKNGQHIQAMATLGFGFIEVGTVTPIPQVGNPQPRLFRLSADEALINRMGFNNAGLEALIKQLKQPRPEGVIIGGNIGKNKITPNEDALSDYQKCFEALFPFVDYFVVNVSSPNTPNLRALQEKGPLTALLSALQKENLKKDHPKPILLKIAPDLSFEQLDDVIEIAETTKIAGIIATNTTIDRSNLQTPAQKIEEIGPGGLSGQPLRQRSTAIIRYINKKTDGKLTIIGVGGIASPKDAVEKLEAGATLVQVYSGFVYEGPQLVKKINQALLQ